MTAERYDVLILGSGQGGDWSARIAYLASHAGQFGSTTGPVTVDMGGLPFTAVRDAVITHLTVSEGLAPLMSNVPPVSDRSARQPSAAGILHVQ